LENVDGFRTELSTRLEETLDVGRNNENLAGVIGEAETEAEKIKEKVNLEFDGAYGEAELLATAKVTDIQFGAMLSSYKDEFGRANNKDEVDGTETALTKNLNNNVAFRRQQLETIINTHNLHNTPFVEELGKRYSKEYERLLSKIG
jgi:hypothetical protein